MPAPLPAPRWQTPLPPGTAGTWGPAVADWSRRELGIELDRWQKRALNRALVVDADDHLLHRHYLISTGRQNGKTVLVRSLIGWALTADGTPPWARIVGVAHDRTQARIPYEAVLADLQGIKRRYGRGLALTRYLGIRSDLYGRHREYHTGSKESRNALRGTTNDLVPFDEVRTQVNYETWNAVLPTTTARPEPLIVGLSTAGDDRSRLLRDWWERGRRIIDGAEPHNGFGMTWYAAGDDDAPDDPRAWRKANPAFAERRLSLAAMRAIVGGLGTLVGIRTEVLNLWSEGGDEWLPAGVWRRQAGPQPATGIRVVLGADATPTWRRCTVSVAILTDAGAWVGVAGELDSLETGSASIAPADLVKLVDRCAREWHATELAYRANATAAPHLAAWAERRHDITAAPLTARGFRDASELFRSELVGGRLTHIDDPLLAQQVRVARPSSSANVPLERADWYFSTRASDGDIDALIAAACAAYQAIHPEEPDPGSQVFLP